MSENLTEGIPLAPEPIPAPKPRRRFPWISILGFIVLIALGLLGGYQSGMGVRKAAQATLVAQQLSEQFQLGEQDLEAGRYEAARQRFEYIIQHNTGYPGITEKLAQVILLMSIPTATPTPTLTPTPDLSGVESIFSRAQQLAAAQDWAGAIGALDQLRKKDPTYRTSEVDGMYYYTLRNNGVDLIVKQCNLEGGIYYLTLAERFLSPLDSYAAALRDNARYYIIGASFWELDWKQAVYYFSQVASTGLCDGELGSRMNAPGRYRHALMRYGDVLFSAKKYCDAYTQYTAAMAYGDLDEASQKNANRAYAICYPPTATPIPTEYFPPEPPPTEPPLPPPTEPPTEPPPSP